MSRTEQAYEKQMNRCRDLFVKKMKDYGTAWRILRISSLVDQIFIKAKRIRNIEEAVVQKVGDSVESEYIGIINYCLMAMIQMELGVDDKLALPEIFLIGVYFEEHSPRVDSSPWYSLLVDDPTLE